MNYSSLSFYCSMAILCTFPLMIILIILIPSPPLCDAIADNAVVLNGAIGFFGTVFSAIGIKESNSVKKWFGLIVNILFLSGLIAILLS